MSYLLIGIASKELPPTSDKPHFCIGPSGETLEDVSASMRECVRYGSEITIAAAPTGRWFRIASTPQRLSDENIHINTHTDVVQPYLNQMEREKIETESRRSEYERNIAEREYGASEQKACNATEGYGADHNESNSESGSNQIETVKNMKETEIDAKQVQETEPDVKQIQETEQKVESGGVNVNCVSARGFPPQQDINQYVVVTVCPDINRCDEMAVLVHGFYSDINEAKRECEKLSIANNRSMDVVVCKRCRWYGLSNGAVTTSEEDEVLKSVITPPQQLGDDLKRLL